MSGKVIMQYKLLPSISFTNKLYQKMKDSLDVVIFNIILFKNTKLVIHLKV